MRLVLIILLISSTLFSQVQLKYDGENDGIKKTIIATNELLKSNEFYKRIATYPGTFTNTKLSPAFIANLMYGYDTTIVIKTYQKQNLFTTLELTKIISPYQIKINTIHFGGKIERRVSILMRDIVRCIDMMYGKAEFTIDLGESKYLSPTYVISDIAEDMVRNGFGYQE